MGFESIFLLGLFMGLTHAFEADHVAAVATMSSEKGSKSKALSYGIFWAIGHGLMISIVFSASIYFAGPWVENLSHYAEMVVAAMLIILGAHIIYRLKRDRVHFHIHHHEDGQTHFHAHSHHNEVGHEASSHQHTHANLFKALAVGTVHGLAGSAVFLLAIGASISTTDLKLLFLVLFTVGSAFGMGALSLVISIPFNFKGKIMTGLYRYLRIGLASLSIVLGLIMMSQLIMPHGVG